MGKQLQIFLEMGLLMKKRGKTLIIILVPVITAAVIAAVIFNLNFSIGDGPILFLPSYSAPAKDKTLNTGDGWRAEQEGRKISVYRQDRLIWELPHEVRAQDFLIEDIDRDGRQDLLILCWRRGRYGKQRPTWVKKDEINWSQHIFVYDLKDDAVVPKWMASDIGVHAASMKYADDELVITDTDGVVTGWKWISWGFEKM